MEPTILAFDGHQRKIRSGLAVALAKCLGLKTEARGEFLGREASDHARVVECTFRHCDNPCFGEQHDAAHTKESFSCIAGDVQ